MAGAEVDPDRVYVVLEKIGKGSFGEVYKGIHRETKEKVAVKIINLELAIDEIEEIHREICFLVECRHPNITKYFSSHIRGMKLWMVMELLVGSLGDMMKPKNCDKYNETEVSVLARSILQGLEYIHGQGKIHRDLKAANVLVSEEGVAKLADFGVATQLTEMKKKSSSVAGTPHWMAPEMLKQEPYDFKVDIWSFGITIIELLEKEPPYADSPTSKAMSLIAYNSPPPLKESYSKYLKDFLQLCLKVNSSERPPAKELLKHKFVKDSKVKKGFMKDRIEKFQEWRLKGGGDTDSDSDSSSEDEMVDTEFWDFSPGSPEVKKKKKDKKGDKEKEEDKDGEEKKKESGKDADWLSKLHNASSSKRKLDRKKQKKRK